MPWWQQAGYCYAATAGVFNYMYWLLWRPVLTGKYDSPRRSKA